MKLYDCHTVLLRTGDLVESEVGSAVEAARIALNIQSTYRFQFFEGRALMWVSNPEFYYILVGHNPDGTVRQTVEWIDHREQEVPLPPLIALEHNEFIIQASRAHLRRRGQLDTSQLCYDGPLPTWLNRDLLRRIFSPFETTESIHYPQIQVSKGTPVLTVKYDPRTLDGSAAMLMVHQAPMQNPYGNLFSMNLYHPQRDFKRTN